MDIVVVGSFMMDLVAKTPRAPKEGETIIGSSFNRYPGGKGANQAVAASRLGGKTTFIGKFGNDLFGKQAIETLENENINIDYVLFDPMISTGVGHITLEENGNNRIVIIPGANMAYTVEDLEKVKMVIKKAKILVLQLEMDLKMIERTIEYAFEFKTPVILNPAPANILSENILSKVTYLTPNESEAELLTGVKINRKEDAVKAADILIKKGINTVVMTLGREGALIANKEKTKFINGFSVEPVDTVAAGDAFNGALAFGLVQNKSIEEAVMFANAVGALTVTKNGAIPSIPNKKEVDSFLVKKH